MKKARLVRRLNELLGTSFSCRQFERIRKSELKEMVSKIHMLKRGIEDHKDPIKDG